MEHHCYLQPGVSDIVYFGNNLGFSGIRSKQVELTAAWISSYENCGKISAFTHKISNFHKDVSRSLFCSQLSIRYQLKHSISSHFNAGTSEHLLCVTQLEDSGRLTSDRSSECTRDADSRGSGQYVNLTTFILRFHTITIESDYIER